MQGFHILHLFPRTASQRVERRGAEPISTIYNNCGYSLAPSFPQEQVFSFPFRHENFIGLNFSRSVSKVKGLRENPAYLEDSVFDARRGINMTCTEMQIANIKCVPLREEFLFGSSKYLECLLVKI